MKDFNEVVICESCRNVVSMSDGRIWNKAPCPKCGSFALGVRFLKRDGSLIVWDEEVVLRKTVWQCMVELVDRLVWRFA